MIYNKRSMHRFEHDHTENERKYRIDSTVFPKNCWRSRRWHWLGKAYSQLLAVLHSTNRAPTMTIVRGINSSSSWKSFICAAHNCKCLNLCLSVTKPLEATILRLPMNRTSRALLWVLELPCQSCSFLKALSKSISEKNADILIILFLVLTVSFSLQTAVCVCAMFIPLFSLSSSNNNNNFWQDHDRSDIFRFTAMFVCS